jgi:hypothetical protein
MDVVAIIAAVDGLPRGTPDLRVIARRAGKTVIGCCDGALG